MNLKKNLVKCTVALSLATMLSIPTNGLAYKEARIGGHDRFDVAINISKNYENSDTCYLINYLAYPDAIASSNYIKDRNGKHIPIYYTKSDKVDTKTLNHLKTKKYKEVVIFGGEKSVSNKVIQQLQNNGFKVSRSLAGKNRYDTVNQLLIGSTNYEDENIILVSGENFADSLIGTSLAKKLNCKIIITPHNKIDETIKNEFFNTNKKQRAKVNNVYIVGGEKSISKNIEQKFSKVAKVHRISGRDRYDTSLQLAKEIGNDKYTVVSGENFADNLVAIPYSYTNNSTIVLTSSKSISNNLKSLIKNKDFTIVGGEKSVPNEILELAKKDSVKPDEKKEKPNPNTPEVTIVSRTNESKTENKDFVDFSYDEFENQQMPKGETKIIEEGTKGYTTYTYSRTKTVYSDGTVKYSDWKETNKKVVAPVNGTKLIGTYEERKIGWQKEAAIKVGQDIIAFRASLGLTTNIHYDPTYAKMMADNDEFGHYAGVIENEVVAYMPTEFDENGANIVGMWKNSPQHKKQLTYDKNEDCGVDWYIGVYNNGKNVYYSAYSVSIERQETFDKYHKKYTKDTPDFPEEEKTTPEPEKPEK